MTELTVVAVDVGSRIQSLRGLQVLLDKDLAAIYGVPTKILNQAIRRNLDRFPEDFRFQLSPDEVANLRSQIVTSKPCAASSSHPSPLARRSASSPPRSPDAAPPAYLGRAKLVAIAGYLATVNTEPPGEAATVTRQFPPLELRSCLGFFTSRRSGRSRRGSRRRSGGGRPRMSEKSGDHQRRFGLRCRTCRGGSA